MPTLFSRPTSVELKLQSSSPSLPLQDPAEAYLRLLRFSSSSKHLLAASTEGLYCVHNYPMLTRAFKPTEDFDGEEIMDADFTDDGNQVVICSARKLKVFGTYPAPPSSSDNLSAEEKGVSDNARSKTEATLAINQSLGKGPKSSIDDVGSTNAVRGMTGGLGEPPTWHSIQNPALGGEENCEFRAVRFGKTPAAAATAAAAAEGGKAEGDASEEASSSKRTMFTVVNAKASRGAGSKGQKGKRKR